MPDTPTPSDETIAAGLARHGITHQGDAASSGRRYLFVDGAPMGAAYAGEAVRLLALLDRVSAPARGA